MNKLPAITLSFWIMKICATTLGEMVGDILSITMNIGCAMSNKKFVSNPKSKFQSLSSDKTLIG
jgi:uncharacterized membrane-anchored protein